MKKNQVLSKVPRVPDRGWSKATISLFRTSCNDLIRRGRLWPATLHLLELYCDSFEIYQLATNEILEDAKNLTKTDRDTTRKSVLFQVRKTSVDEIKNFERKLGFSPYYADRIKDDDTNPKESDPFENF